METEPRSPEGVEFKETKLSGVIVEHKSLDDLFKEVEWTHVDRDVPKFEVEQAEPETVDLYELEIPRTMTGAEIIQAMNDQGYEASGLADLVAAAKYDVELGKGRMVVALKDHCEGRRDKMDSTPMVAPYEGGRALGTARFVREREPEKFTFLARKKAT